MTSTATLLPALTVCPHFISAYNQVEKALQSISYNESDKKSIQTELEERGLGGRRGYRDEGRLVSQQLIATVSIIPQKTNGRHVLQSIGSAKVKK